MGFHRAFRFARGDKVADGGHDGILAGVAELVNYLCERRNFGEGDRFHGGAERDGELDVHMWMS